MEKAIKILQRPTVEDPYGIGNKNYNDQREFSFSKLICFFFTADIPAISQSCPKGSFAQTLKKEDYFGGDFLPMDH